MTQIAAFATRLAKDEEGAALVEYGLLIGLIAIGCIAAIGVMRGEINALFGRVSAALRAAVAG